jgi:Winged helix DNA-binding domain
MLTIDRQQALAFRVAGHHLHERTDPLTAVAAIGLQDYPPGWAAVALYARTHADLDPGEVVKVNAMRGAPYVVPREDASIFTAAIVPDEDGLRAFVGEGSEEELREAGFTVREALDLIAAAAREGLAEGPLDRDSFHQALRERLPQGLLPWCPGCQSHHVRPGLWRRLGPLGVTQMPAKATFALADYPTMPIADARDELARRFLRCYGPATPSQLAGWARTSSAHAKALFDGIADELAQVRIGGRRGFVLAEDLPRLENPPPARGVRLLGGHDPYVAQPDRDALTPDRELRRRLFPSVGRPGVVLHEGVLAGLWRGRKAGETLDVEVEWLGRPVDITEEANAVARLRGCGSLRLAA